MIELDARAAILGTLLTTPHRDLDTLWPIHVDAARRDPRFYVHLAAWYFDKGEVRDHKELFVAYLALSTFAGHRDVGLALLRRLPPYEVARVIDFIHGDRRAAEAKAAAALAAKPAKKRAKASAPKGKPAGLFRNLPRSLRTEVERYLREREADDAAFDQVALHGRKALKRLYALLHVKPGPRAQAILFDDAPPAGSRPHALKLVAKMTDPVEQARAIVEHRIPFRIAAGAIKRITPSVLVALVDAMSSQELINHLGALREHGAFDDPGLAALIDERLERAQADGRVSAFKAEVAAEAAGVSAETRSKLIAITDARTKAKGRIKRSTALLCDKSGSMQEAIAVTKRLGSLVASLVDAPLSVWAFDTAAYPITPGDASLESWEKAFVGIAADGGTACGAAVQAMRKRKEEVEQLVIVTDEEENTPPLLVDELRKYRDELEVDPQVVIVRVGKGLDLLEKKLVAAGIQVSVFRFAGDYYALPNVIPFLLAPSRVELVLEVLEHPLPARPTPVTVRGGDPAGGSIPAVA